MNEKTRHQAMDWDGIQCQLSKKDGTEVITSISEADNAEYQNATHLIVARTTEVVKSLESLNIFDPDISIESFSPRLAVLPRHEFEPKLFKGMPNPEDWAWAQACVREYGDHQFVLYDSSIANSSWENQGLMDPNELRELTHEFAHPWLNRALSADIRKGSIAFSEMVVETIPRILLHYQQNMPESTKFLISLKDEDVLTLGSIDRAGWGCFPPKPLKENPVYGGIFLAGLPILNYLGQGNYEKGLSKLVQTAQRSNNVEEMWQELSRQGVDLEWFLNTTEPIHAGQAILRDHV